VLRSTLTARPTSRRFRRLYQTKAKKIKSLVLPHRDKHAREGDGGAILLENPTYGRDCRG
jgi:hypothetical protein